MSERSKMLLRLIEAAGLSYGELSNITGIPKSAIQRYATGETEKIPIDRIESLAHALSIPPEYLMGWDTKSDIDPLTTHEQKVITAYRAQPDMQGPVDKLLGISDDKEMSGGRYRIQAAAYGGGVHWATPTASKEELEKLAKEAEIKSLMDDD